MSRLGACVAGMRGARHKHNLSERRLTWGPFVVVLLTRIIVSCRPLYLWNPPNPCQQRGGLTDCTTPSSALCTLTSVRVGGINSCFHKLRVLLVVVVLIRAVLFGVGVMALSQMGRSVRGLCQIRGLWQSSFRHLLVVISAPIIVKSRCTLGGIVALGP